MRVLTLAAIIVGAWVVPSQISPPKKGVIQTKSATSTQITSEAQQKQRDADTEAIKAMLAGIQQQNSQILTAQATQSGQNIEIQGKLVKYTSLIHLIYKIYHGIFTPFCAALNQRYATRKLTS